MRQVRCPDPCALKPCSWWEGGEAPAGARWVEGDRLGVGAEVLRHELEWRRLDELLPRAGPWSLRLDALVPGEDDELAALQSVLSRAAAHGCDRVLVSLCAPEGRPPELRELLRHDRAYRYRFFGLLRALCDEHGLKFAALELGELPDDLRFNRFFGTAKPCCRGFP